MAGRTPRTERTQIAGPAGALEALIEEPAAAAVSAFGVICHPHPSYGGTLDNKVIYTLSRAFHEFGVPTIRFNFRGVGASAGAFADGLGETEDTLAVAAAGQARWPGASLWLAGFSFGSVVAIRAAVEARAERLVTVAPAIARVAVGDGPLPQCPWLLIQGDADELVDAREVLDWAARLSPPPEVALLAGVGHFFHGRLHELRDSATAFLAKQKPG
jgi:alpha/beta superfamily hydrolase